MSEISPETTTDTDASGVVKSLQDKFPEAIQEDTRDGYEGIIVDSDKLVEVATAIRDDLGYELLSHHVLFIKQPLEKRVWD